MTRVGEQQARRRLADYVAVAGSPHPAPADVALPLISHRAVLDARAVHVRFQWVSFRDGSITEIMSAPNCNGPQTRRAFPTTMQISGGFAF
jgi:hypothetical protein